MEIRGKINYFELEIFNKNQETNRYEIRLKEITELFKQTNNERIYLLRLTNNITDRAKEYKLKL